MSRQQSIQQQKVRKCAVCFDAGKPESEYSSHWVKDNMGIVCCPTLMRQPCRYCDKVGHTVKFCQELIKETEKNQKMERKRKAAEAFNTSTTVTSAKTNTKKANKWAAFEDDSDEDKEEEEDAPTTTIKTWASIVATTTTTVHSLQKSAAVNPFSKFVNSDNRPKVFASSLSWADIVDSDDEEECYV
jgi:hypothetical protein